MEVGGVLDPNAYIGSGVFHITPYCQDGFVDSSLIVYSGELSFSFTLKTGNGGGSKDLSLVHLFGEDGLSLRIVLSYSQAFAAAFESAIASPAIEIDGATAAYQASAPVANSTSYLLDVPYFADGAGTVAFHLDLDVPAAYCSPGNFAGIAESFSSLEFELCLGG